MDYLKIQREGMPPSFSNLPCHCYLLEVQPILCVHCEVSHLLLAFLSFQTLILTWEISLCWCVALPTPRICNANRLHLHTLLAAHYPIPWFKWFFTWCKSLSADCLALWLRPSGYVLIQNLLFLNISQPIKHMYNPAISGLKSCRSLSELQIQDQ